jgi:RNA polymerase sigma-70 factor (ECF subfamily)
MKALDDAAIIARSREEPELFAVLFDRHFGVIHGYLGRRIGPDRADDLAADVFSIAFQSRARFQPVHASARPWLYGIASNLLLRHRRSELRRLHALGRLKAAEVDPLPGLDAAGERADAASLRRPLFEALARLEARDRDVLLLVAWEGLTYEEVAAALEIPVGTVRSRLNRARKGVRAALAGCESDGACTSVDRLLGGIDA